MRLTLGALRAAANWGNTIGLCPTSDEFTQVLNQALERLMHAGKWVGLIQRYQLCTSAACITLPRQFNTVEVMDVCNAPIPIRNGWFEFVDNGPGRATPNGGNYFNLLDRGRGYALFSDPTETCILRLVPRSASDVGKVINIRGVDANGDIVYTASGNTLGEDVTLALPFVDTVTEWGAQTFRDVQKAVTKGYVDVYWYPVGDDSSPTKCGQWEPAETLPDYRRYYLPYIVNMSSCDQSTGACGESATPCSSPNVTVTALVKLAFVPLSGDNNEFLPLSNVPALKQAMRAVQLEERGDVEGARYAMQGTWDAAALRFVGGAIPLLEEELAEHLGDGVVHTPRFQSKYSWGFGGVENLIS